jgi:hypothetical protein
MQSDTFKKMELQFILGEEEQALVNMSSSIFILGRSGTGKTTVMLAKMLLKEEVLHAAEVEELTGKQTTQWLVTCNNVLKNASEQYYSRIRLSCPKLKDSNLPEFFSFRDILIKIDSNVQKSFLLKGVDATSADSDYVHYDVESVSVEHGGLTPNRIQNEVTFQQFSTLYYPRFSESVKKVYSATIIWTEIQVDKTDYRALLRGLLRSWDRNMATSHWTTTSTNRFEIPCLTKTTGFAYTPKPLLNTKR